MQGCDDIAPSPLFGLNSDKGKGRSGTNGNRSEQNIDPPANGDNLGSAAIAGGVIGLVLGGPLLAVAGAAGIAVAATTGGAAGDIARASGEIVIAAGDKAKEINQAHNIVGNTRGTVENAWEKTKQYEAKNGIFDGIKDFIKSSVDKTFEYEKENKIFARMRTAITDGAQFLASRINESSMCSDDSANLHTSDNEGTSNVSK
mmetsp:Transcript_64505/g.77444  ORF Transcript_64505/g.77444 Transcript_64505/m.77444 type:complete len:202 (-) Transcript_64505:146-751(-)